MPFSVWKSSGVGAASTAVKCATGADAAVAVVLRTTGVAEADAQSRQYGLKRARDGCDLSLPAWVCLRGCGLESNDYDEVEEHEEDCHYVEGEQAAVIDPFVILKLPHVSMQPWFPLVS